MSEFSQHKAGRFRLALEMLANLGIVVVAILGSVVLAKQLMSGSSAPAVRQVPLSRPSTSTVGSPVTLPGVDFATAERTLVLVLSTGCHFCSDSGPFYRRLAEETQRAGTTRLVAVLPQARDVATKFLSGLGVGVAEVVQAAVNDVGVRGTPTLLLVDRRGRVLRTWVGRLAPERESEVLAAVAATLQRGAS